jgi:hypothetical protein
MIDHLLSCRALKKPELLEDDRPNPLQPVHHLLSVFRPSFLYETAPLSSPGANSEALRRPTRVIRDDGPLIYAGMRLSVPELGTNLGTNSNSREIL